MMPKAPLKKSKNGSTLYPIYDSKGKLIYVTIPERGN